MSIDDFVQYGLEPGQHGLIWDFETKTYIPIHKPSVPHRAWTYLVGLAATATIHGFAAILLIGGFTS